MQIKCLGMCRGDGKGYVKLTIGGIENGNSVSVRTVLEDGSLVPSLWVLENSSADETLGTVVFPLLDESKLVMQVSSDVNPSSFRSMSISATRLKWASRLNYRMRAKQCSGMRDIDERDSNRMRVSLLTCMPDGSESVWRIAADSPDPDSSLTFGVWGGDGRPLDIEPVFFEDQLFPIDAFGTSRRRVTVSVRIPASVESFSVLAQDATGNVQAGMFGVDRAMFFGELQNAMYRVRSASFGEDYQAWRAATQTQASVLSEDGSVLAQQPLISIVVPCFRSNESFLRAMIESVQAQTYRVWELILVDSEQQKSQVAQIATQYDDERIRVIPLDDNKGIVGNTNLGVESARGEYVAFLDYDDVLEPNALVEYVRAINDHPNAGALYCDEDSFEVLGTYFDPVFKTDFNRDLLYAHNCVTHWLMVRSSVLDEIGLSDSDTNGAQDYDLTLRVSETGYDIVHVPQVLYHWRRHADSTAGDNVGSKPYAHEAGKTALKRHFERRGLPVRLEDGDGPFVYRVRYELPSPKPSVEIIIPSKDHSDVLDRCVTSILERSTYDNYRITIIENNSKEEVTFSYYRELQARTDRVRVLEWPDEFNYAKIINYGAAQTDADLLLLLNNDTEVISPDFIEEMAGYLQRPEVGVVGAKLFYYDDLVQHSGMLVGPHDTVVHVNQNVPDSWGGYLGRAFRPGNYSSVTGACQMVKRSVFNEVGGYSEEFAVGYNDADFCCKVAEVGYLITFTPYAKLYHNEFVSRGREEGDAGKTARWQRERLRMIEKWPRYFTEGDPFSNPNLDKDSLYSALPGSTY